RRTGRTAMDVGLAHNLQQNFGPLSPSHVKSIHPLLQQPRLCRGPGTASYGSGVMLNNNKIGKPLMSGPAPAGRIMRHNLLTLLDQSAQFPLTLLLAPAGYGKSTLLQQWQTLRPSKAVVRLTVQRQNSDAGQFFQHLIDGLRQVVPYFDTASYSPFSREISLPPESVAESLRQALQSVPDELFIILDDFQDATAPEVQKVIAALLEQLPPSVHFILASRTWPQFSLSRLRLEERLF